jgi:hypothetical protein
VGGWMEPNHTTAKKRGVLYSYFTVKILAVFSAYL